MTMIEASKRGRPVSSFALALALSGLALTGGCISLLPDPPKPVPVLPLQAAEGLRPVANPLPAAIGVMPPTMDRFFATNRVVVRDDDGSLAYLEGVRLSAPAIAALQSLMIQTIDRTQAARGAVRADSTARPEYEIHSDISIFEVTLPGSRRSDGVATIEGAVRLIRTVDGAVLGSRVIRATAPARRGQPVEAVRGLQAAAQDFNGQMIVWLLETAPRPAPSSTVPASP